MMFSSCGIELITKLTVKRESESKRFANKLKVREVYLCDDGNSMDLEIQETAGENLKECFRLMFIVQYTTNFNHLTFERWIKVLSMKYLFSSVFFFISTHFLFMIPESLLSNVLSTV